MLLLLSKVKVNIYLYLKRKRLSPKGGAVETRESVAEVGMIGDSVESLGTSGCSVERNLHQCYQLKFNSVTANIVLKRKSNQSTPKIAASASSLRPAPFPDTHSLWPIFCLIHKKRETLSFFWLSCRCQVTFRLPRK